MNISQRNPRILFAIMDMPPVLTGGSLVYINTIMTHLAPECVTLVSFSSTNPNDDRVADEKRPFQTIRLPISFSYYAYPKGKLSVLKLMRGWLCAFWKYAKRDMVDVVVLENILFMGLVARFICRVRQVPYVVFCFGEELSLVLQSDSSWCSRVRRLIYQWTLHGASAIVSISSNTSELLAHFGVDAYRILLIYPPTPVPKQLPSNQAIRQFRVQYGLENKRILCSVGRLVRRKGHDRLLEAMPDVIEKFPDTVLILASAGEMEAELLTMINKLQLANHVRLLGGVDKTTLRLLYSSCELFVMPNRTLPNGDLEGYGIVFNEANAFGKPVIGGRSGGTIDAIVDEETGILIDGDDPDAIAAAIIRLLDDSKLAKRLGENGKCWVQDARSPQHAADQFLSLARMLTATPDN